MDPPRATARLCQVGDKTSRELGKADCHSTCLSITLTQRTTRSFAAVSPMGPGEGCSPSPIPARCQKSQHPTHPSSSASSLPDSEGLQQPRSLGPNRSPSPSHPLRQNHPTPTGVTCNPSSSLPGITYRTTAGEVREGIHTFWLASHLSDTLRHFQFNMYFFLKLVELKQIHTVRQFPAYIIKVNCAFTNSFLLCELI